MTQASEDVPSSGGSSGSTAPARAMAITCLIGLILTAVSAWAAHRADGATEERLLDRQTKQAAAVLSTAVFVIQQPMTTALQVQEAAGANGDPSVFRDSFGVNVGRPPESIFVSASLWQRDGRALKRLAAVGSAPGLEPRGPEMRTFLNRALTRSTSVVQFVEADGQTRIAFALAEPATGFIVYAERAIAADRRASVDSDSAYSQLHYAIYLGEQTRLDDMTTTDVDPADLPLTGTTDRETVPFGDTVLTLVTQPGEHLGSPLSDWLPSLLLLGGLLLTLATTLVTRQLVATRIRIEAGSSTITALYQRINGLYEEQRALFLRLQRALLPQADPVVPELDIASKYVAGTEGIEIGGDWYSVINVGDDHFGFVVGDVSGRGVDAVAVMARARFTLRAYLLDGNPPEVALEKCARQFDVTVDDHIVTALVGVGTWRTGEVVLASAGHPPPVVIHADRAEFLPVPVGPPLGVGASTYTSASFWMDPGSALIAYTDGLVERRGENIDIGLERLLAAAESRAQQALPDLLSGLLDELRTDDTTDDIALLALRRQPASTNAASPGRDQDALQDHART
jgi:serine phosphatase RsbU (regulator of sigma subunit)